MSPGLDEFARIDRYLAPLAGKIPGAWNLSDDAAWVANMERPGWLITADALVAGVHFPDDDLAGDIARRLLRVNLSDMAAMGAIPQLYFMTLALPPIYDDRWLADFAAGLEADQHRFNIALAGGDCVAIDGPAVLSVTMLGYPSASTPLRRLGAQSGDFLAVSGQLGDAALALRHHQKGLDVSPDDAAFFEARRLSPEPRLTLGAQLAGLAHAAIDISDGLVADLGHLCQQSGLGAEIWADRIPLSAAARRALGDHPNLLERILTGGDDYELLFACHADDWPTISKRATDCGVPVTRIGIFKSDHQKSTHHPVTVIDAEGRQITLDQGGYRHF